MITRVRRTFGGDRRRTRAGGLWPQDDLRHQNRNFHSCDCLLSCPFHTYFSRSPRHALKRIGTSTSPFLSRFHLRS